MIKNIVFDMGGVLIDFDPRRYIARVTQDPADAELLRQELFVSEEWARTDRGDMTYDEVAVSVCNRLPERLHGFVRRLLDEWVLDMPPVPGMEQLAADLKTAGYRLYLLSNTCEKFHTFRELIPALRHFDGEFASADWHLVKPEAEIFRAFFSYFGLVPAECVFIDDSPQNIEAASRCGMRGFVFHGDAAAARRFLEKLLGRTLPENHP